MTIKNTKTHKPVIGIILSLETEDQSYSRYPWYGLRANYSDAVEQAGGIPVMLPYSMKGIEHYAELCDGLVIAGGNFDISPALYGEAKVHESVTLNASRTEFEMEMLKAYFPRGKPILGVCGGEQLLNVYAGGTLIQDIPSQVPDPLNHTQDYPKEVPSHQIKCSADTKLLEIVQNEYIMVNSTHHQAVGKVGNGMVASAYAADGIIEAIEHAEHVFCLGVQWHPEYMYTEHDIAIFRAFVQAAV